MPDKTTEHETQDTVQNEAQNTIQDKINHIMEHGFPQDDYPHLAKYATIMPPPSRPIVGREHEMRRLLASLNRAELSNAFLLGDAGSGKTMLVQGTSEKDKRRIYVEVDLAKMSASEAGEDGAVQMASRIKGLFDEAERYKKSLSEYDASQTRELVMFIDEFHLLVQLSPAAAQAIKPVLAESGRRGIKIIAATTFAEFHEYVEKDQALMQRLQRINIEAPEKEVVVSILRSIAENHGVLHDIYDSQLFELIYDYSNRYVPADSQPRKSILMLDAMIGWFRTYPGEYRMDKHLLADVIYDSAGVRVTFEIDGRKIEHELNKRVFAQGFATKSIEERLQIAVADLHDKSRPISSFLFTGSTGTGKTEMVKAMSNLLFGSDNEMIRFDMSEYSLNTSIERFREELTDKVWNKSHSIILFDEVEKAHESITRIMLQVLDDGRLSNAQGREVSFLNTYIVLTTNAGSEIYENISHYRQSDDGADGLQEYQKVIRNSLMNHESFAPEILGRVNGIIPFQPLSHATFKRIIARKLANLKDEINRIHGIDVLFHKDVVDYIVLEKYDVDTSSGGARGVVAQLDTEVTSRLSRYINLHPNVKRIGVYIDGTMAHRDKSIREGDARVAVGTIRSRSRRETS